MKHRALIPIESRLEGVDRRNLKIINLSTHYKPGLALEMNPSLKERGKQIIGEGESADAYHITASHPEGLGAKLVMERALADANLKPEDIDLSLIHISAWFA